MAFEGVKAAVFVGERVLLLLRDHRPGIPWPGCWDLVGGGREGAERPEETLAREMAEEVALDLAAAEVRWRREVSGGRAWFFVVRFPEAAVRGIALGDEGDAWALMAPERAMRLEGAVPLLRERLGLWLHQRSS